jgi:hypothetical protein
MLIYITKITEPVKNDGKNEIIKIDPSLYHSQLVIPAYYDFYVGIFQLSFDTIYFTRNKLYKGEKNEDFFIEMESFPFGMIEYPLKENSGKYEIYFTQKPE